MEFLDDKLVAKQYNDYIYPEPITDMAKWISEGKRLALDLELNRLFFWPKNDKNNQLNILVAGCGTNQAAYHAMRNPNSCVIGLDFSLQSLQHEKYLKQKHNIENLYLYQGNILDIDKLNQKFDLIYCTGVLHHMPSPDAGLIALKSVLKPDGVMGLMLYGKSMRMGVYMLQEALKIMRLDQKPESVQKVKKILEELKPHHACNAYIKNAIDLKYDSGIVDTFLHPVDRAYSVKELLHFIRSNDLEFMRWVKPTLYDLDFNFKKNEAAYELLNSISVEDRWHAIDLLNQALGKHEFIVSHPEHARNSSLNFNSSEYKTYTPLFHQSTRTIKVAQDINDSSIIQVQGIDFTIKGLELIVLSEVNGKNDISAIINSLNLKFNDKNWEEISINIFKRLNELGAMAFIKK